MNITQETNDYFSTTEPNNPIKPGVQSHASIDYFNSGERELYNSIHKRMLEGIKSKIDPDKSYLPIEYCNANSGLKDKLKTTPDPAIKSINKVFRLDWNKVFKRGWLLWK